MKVEIIENWDGFNALTQEWGPLLRSSRADTVFLTWEWMDAWRRTVGECVKPFIIVVRDTDNALIGLGAFYTVALRLAGVLLYRCLRVMGDFPTGGEYQDWIVREDCEGEASAAIARMLAAQADRWDLMWLPSVSGWTGAYDRIVSACTQAGLRWQARDKDFSAIALPATFADYEKSLSSKTRYAARHARRAILERAQAQFDMCRSAENLPAFLDALYDLNERRWSAANKIGNFVRKPLEAQFYREFTPLALERSWLCFSGLRLDGELKAVDIGYVYNSTFFGLQSGFDPAGLPGIRNVLRGKMLEMLINEGVKTYDMLGEFVEYKRRSGATQRMGHRVLIGNPGLKTTPVFLSRCWPGGRLLCFVDLPN